jgi:hypothetical protein
MCLAVNNKDKVMKLGAGARDTATNVSCLNGAVGEISIPKELQLINEDDGRCVWLSVYLLINMTDHQEATRLAKISKCDEKRDIFEFLHLTKTKKQVVARRVNSYWNHTPSIG